MRRTRVWLFVAMMAVGTTAAGCGSEEQEEDPLAAPVLSKTVQIQEPPESITADPARSAEGTMILVAETALSMYPLSEEPGDSWRRADEALSAEGHFPHRGEQVEVPRGRGQWFDWQSRGVEWVEARATVTSDEHPPDTDTIAARVLEVKLTEHTARGANRGVEKQTYYATVTRSSQNEPWRLETLAQP